MDRWDSADQRKFIQLTEAWLAQQTSRDAFREQLGVDQEWMNQFEMVLQRYQLQVSNTAVSKIQFTPLTVSGAVQPDDEVLVFVDSIKISRLFTDAERLERGEQEGFVAFHVNGQSTTVNWKRPLIRRLPKAWGPLNDRQPRLLYAGNPRGLLDLDISVVESDEAEKEFFQRIADLLRSAAAFSGLIPGSGTAASAALNVGAAIAELIKAKIDNDAEMRFLGTLGGEDFSLHYGEYRLQRNAFSQSNPEIEIRLRIEKFSKQSLPKKVTILLDSIEFQQLGNQSIANLNFEDRVVSDISVTQIDIGSEPGQSGEPTTRVLKIDRPYFGENQANWTNTFAIRDKLLYDGPWGINLALTLNLSGIPREINDKEWMAVVSQTGALINSLAPADDRDSIRRGFAIAETVRSEVLKYLPKTRFSASLSTLLFVGNPIIGAHALSNTNAWQLVEIPLDLDDYGLAVFRLKVLLQA